jgi:hypothetical protein
MYKHRFIKLLLLPSLFSTVITSVLALAIIVGVNWSLIVEHFPFSNYFFGADGAVSSLQGATEEAIVASQPLDGGRVVAILVGVILVIIAAVALVRSIVGIMNGISWTMQEIHAVEGPAKRTVERELGKRVTVRLLVITTWAAYTFIFVKIILPFCILASQLGFDSEHSVSEGIGYVFFALVLLGLSVHLHTIMARLLLLRPRVFGGEEAILVN